MSSGRGSILRAQELHVTVWMWQEGDVHCDKVLPKEVWEAGIGSGSLEWVQAPGELEDFIDGWKPTFLSLTASPGPTMPEATHYASWFVYPRPCPSHWGLILATRVLSWPWSGPWVPLSVHQRKLQSSPSPSSSRSNIFPSLPPLVWR